MSSEIAGIVEKSLHPLMNAKRHALHDPPLTVKGDQRVAGFKAWRIICHMVDLKGSTEMGD